MALLDLLNSKGSVYTKPSTIQYQQKTKVVGLLPKSSLDLNGKKPTTYKDKAPEGQSGRI
jgi:hypothetical protein